MRTQLQLALDPVGYHPVALARVLRRPDSYRVRTHFNAQALQKVRRGRGLIQALDPHPVDVNSRPALKLCRVDLRPAAISSRYQCRFAISG